MYTYLNDKDMNRNFEQLSKVKKISWNNRVTWIEANPDSKLLSTYKIFEALQKPKDWHAIAKKCSTNPTHEMFGVEPEMILQKWQTKGATGANRGIKLDDYITAKLSNEQFDIESITDENLLAKCVQFDCLHANVLSKLHSYVGSEIWLNSLQLGLSIRCDAMFTLTDDRSCFIPDWKNNEKLSTVNSYRQKLLGPLNNIDDTDLAKYTLQTYLYKYVIEEEMNSVFDTCQTRIMNITSTDVKTWSGAFEYDKQLIAEIVKFTNQTMKK